MLKKLALTCLASLSLIGLGASPNPAVVPGEAENLEGRIQDRPLLLQVEPIRQLLYTSCGEAAVTMAYNHAHPHAPIDERSVIEFAKGEGYFTQNRPPFTSPGDMLNIASHYAEGVKSGSVVHSSQGLALLTDQLENGEPVIIDVLSQRYNPDSPAHFILVTGMSVDPERGNALMIHFNDPLTGASESARWDGNEGIWNAWKNNGDPGGSGWWMAIPFPLILRAEEPECPV